MNPQEPVPNVGRSLLKRGALAGLVIVLLAAGSVSAWRKPAAETVPAASRTIRRPQIAPRLSRPAPT